MITPKPGIIVRNGHEYPLHMLNRGDQIAYREFDTARQCYVFTVLTEVPASPGAPDRGCAASPRIRHTSNEEVNDG